MGDQRKTEGDQLGIYSFPMFGEGEAARRYCGAQLRFSSEMSQDTSAGRFDGFASRRSVCHCVPTLGAAQGRSDSPPSVTRYSPERHPIVTR